MSRVPRLAALALLLALGAGTGLWWLAAPGAPVNSTASREVPAPSLGESLGAPTLSGLPDAKPRASRTPAAEQPGDATASDESVPPQRSVSLRVIVVDALTGRDVEATWNIDFPELGLRGYGGPSLREPYHGEAFRQQEVKLAQERADWLGRFVAAGTARKHHVDDLTARVWNFLEVRPPAGFVMLTTPALLDAVLAVGVDSLTAVVPVIREAVLDVHVIGPDGRAAEGARLVHFAVGGVAWAHTVEDTGPGTLRVRGIPHLAGERITAGIEWGTEDGLAAPPTVDMESEEPPSNLTASIPDSLAAPWTVELRLSAPTGSLGDHIETDFEAAFKAWAPKAGK